MRPQRGATPVLALLLTHVATAENTCVIPGSCDDPCQLFLAPSTIPDAGLGVFTAKELKKGDIIGNGDISVPLVDIKWHSGYSDDVFSHFKDYVWLGSIMGMIRESDGDDVTSFCPGVDAAINCNSALLNTDYSIPTYDTAGLHRNRDPGAGAITPYHNGTTFASAPIPVGGELFKYYGDNWFETRPFMGQIPLEDHYEEAETLVEDFEAFTLSREGMQALWNIVATMPWESRLYNALPKTMEDAMKGAREGLRSLHQPSALRSIDYLNEHGRCMDNILAGDSTVRGAGRGAFATRFLPEGSVVTGSPLLHVPDRTYVNMYDVEDGDETDSIRNVSSVIGQQLLVNYCYGHSESTLLLCPYGSGVGYINHHSTKVNVRLQWAPHGMMSHNDEWLVKEVPDMEWDWTVSLAFDFVATRDILPGEELFLDYGEEWETAWRAHLDNWEPVEGSEEYVSAREMNEKTGGIPLRTKSEQEIEPYPQNVELLCHDNFEDRKRMRMLKVDEWDAWGLECDIIDRVSVGDNFEYTVKAQGSDEAVSHVSRGAFSFVDKPYTTDIHLENTFRHEIMIPEEMFPEAWKNDKSY